jgi:hypothetical protein
MVEDARKLIAATFETLDPLVARVTLDPLEHTVCSGRGES